MITWRRSSYSGYNGNCIEVSTATAAEIAEANATAEIHTATANAATEAATVGNREALGRLVRETWVRWAREQPFPKPSWLTGWDQLDEGQREVDMRIGEAIAAAERQRILAALTDAQRGPFKSTAEVVELIREQAS